MRNQTYSDASPAFQQLVKIRSRVRFGLAFLVLLLHGFFVGGIAFYHQWFSEPLGSSSITVGIAAVVAVIVLMVFCEAVYIVVSKKVFDPLQKKALEERGE